MPPTLLSTHTEPLLMFCTAMFSGLPFAQTTHDPDQLQEYFPPQFRPKSRKEAEYMMNWYNWVVSAERDKIQLDYENRARMFLCKQNKEAENM